MRRAYCEECGGKRAYHTKHQARDGMAALLRRRARVRDNDFALCAYKCPHENGFHFGHKYETTVIFMNAKPSPTAS